MDREAISSTCGVMRHFLPNSRPGLEYGADPVHNADEQDNPQLAPHLSSTTDSKNWILMTKKKPGMKRGAPLKSLVATLTGAVSRTPPIWLMRQAGRYLPEYRALRLKARSFLDFCFTPDLAIEATLQPVRRYGLDAAILFSDILTVPWAMGQPVAFVEGEGPRLTPVRDQAAVARLEVDGAVERLRPVYETVAGVAAALPSETALIGFAGAPWTVAAYMIEGGGSRDFEAARRWAYADPDGFAELIARLVRVTVDHLGAQIEAGAETVQLFDSWAGVLAPTEFERWVIRPTRLIVDGLRKRHPGVPIIGFPRGSGAMLPRYADETCVSAVGVDTATSFGWAASAVPGAVAIQGNLDPVALMVGGDALDQAAKAILEQAGSRPFVFNLGHGVPQATPPEHVAHLVRLVRGT
jgi:uroporphyrinogen decarboxylase